MRRYGIVLLVIECMGASTVLTYGLWLLFHPVQEDFEEDPHKPGMPKVHLSFQDPNTLVYLSIQTGVPLQQPLIVLSFRPLPSWPFCRSGSAFA